VAGTTSFDERPTPWVQPFPDKKFSPRDSSVSVSWRVIDPYGFATESGAERRRESGFVFGVTFSTSRIVIGCPASRFATYDPTEFGPFRVSIAPERVDSDL
jgi:hypothetical protein